MVDLEFKTSGDVVKVNLKGVRIFIIDRTDTGRYWINTHGSFINFLYIGANPDNDKDFVEYYKYSRTLDEAKDNCNKIMDSYINWLTEK